MALVSAPLEQALGNVGEVDRETSDRFGAGQCSREGGTPAPVRPLVERVLSEFNSLYPNTIGAPG
jgi:hypothetical protein